MKLEAVTVCVNYGDFLAQTAPYNAPIFDRWIIVTDPEDTETRAVARLHNLQVVLSKDYQRNGAAFNKGLMVERGLHHLSGDAWRVHLDADIVLPSRTKHILETAHLDENVIYGCDRINCQSWDRWIKLQASGFVQGTHDRFPYAVLFPDGYPVGARWAAPQTGYVPIGFFQMWHSSEDEIGPYRVKPYPCHHGNACRNDVQHGLQWDRRQRQLLPELVVVHLESEPGKMGANWSGRKTPRFGLKPYFSKESMPS